jgi:hypothetical protein
VVLVVECLGRAVAPALRQGMRRNEAVAAARAARAGGGDGVGRTGPAARATNDVADLAGGDGGCAHGNTVMQRAKLCQAVSGLYVPTARGALRFRAEKILRIRFGLRAGSESCYCIPMTETTAAVTLTLGENVPSSKGYDAWEVAPQADAFFEMHGSLYRIARIWDGQWGLSIDVVEQTKRGRDRQVNGWMWLTLNNSLRRNNPGAALLVERSVAAGRAN